MCLRPNKKLIKNGGVVEYHEMQRFMKEKNMQSVLNIKVVPRSGVSKIVVDKAGMLKCYLKNAPEKGLANDELVKIIAKTVGVPQAAVNIISGATSRNKKVRIVGISVEVVLEKLGIKHFTR